MDEEKQQIIHTHLNVSDSGVKTENDNERKVYIT